jgi:hypothetical protein
MARRRRADGVARKVKQKVCTAFLPWRPPLLRAPPCLLPRHQRYSASVYMPQAEVESGTDWQHVLDSITGAVAARPQGARLSKGSTRMMTATGVSL